VLVEAAKMAPRLSPELASLYDREKQKGNANRASLAVARKLVAYLVAIDRRQKDFLVVENQNPAAGRSGFRVLAIATRNSGIRDIYIGHP
jgi:hypothetical protein